MAANAAFMAFGGAQPMMMQGGQPMMQQPMMQQQPMY